MRKPLISSLLFITIGSVLTFLLFLGGQYLHPSPAQRFLITQLMRKADSVEVFSTGGSLGIALDLEVMGYNGYQMWQPGAGFFETRYTLEYLVPRLPKLHTVFIPVSYIDFWTCMTDSLDYVWVRQKLYTEIPSSRWIKGDIKNYLLGKIKIIVREDHWKRYFSKIKYNLLKNNGKRQNISYNTLQDVNELLRFGQAFTINEFGLKAKNDSTSWDVLQKKPKKLGLTRHQKLQTEMEQINPSCPQESCDELKSIIEYLRTEGIRLILYTPPLFHHYTEAFNPKIIQEMHQIMGNLKKEYNIEYYDFSMDAEFIYNKQIFIDDHHLNRDGAYLFSKKFKNIINDINPQPNTSEFDFGKNML